MNSDMNSYLNSYLNCYEFRYEFMIMNLYPTFHHHDYEFRYELMIHYRVMYLKNMVESYMKLGGLRFQMPSPTAPSQPATHWHNNQA